MDQTIINWLFAGFGAALGWVLKVVWDAIKDLKTDVKQIERALPEIHVRTDMKEGLSKVYNNLNLIFKNIERKEDKW